jgi:hypothetical protein
MSRISVRFNSAKRTLGVLTVTSLTIAFLAGCAGGPSQEEFSVLEQKRQAMEAAQQQVADKKAEKARLERKLAEKQATKKALEEKKAATAAALAEME